MFLALIAAIAFQDLQMPGTAMAERISDRVANAAPTDCDNALTEAEVRNAEALFTGASICAAISRDDDATFLLLAAQARAMADMAAAMPESLPPADADGRIDLSNQPEPPFGVIDLYGFIYGYGGGAGPNELYRDEVRTERLFARLRQWEPRRPSSYDPGWSGSRIVSQESYSATIAEQVAYRIDQLSPLARLYRDDAYYALELQAEALRAENNSTFEVDTPAYERYQAIEAEKAALAEELGIRLR